MSSRVGLASLVALAVVATPAIAAAPTDAVQASASKDDEKVVCKGQTRPNSRFKDRVCKTRAQWEQMRVQQQQDAKEWIDRPTVNGQRGG